MFYIVNTETDLYFNLALEEYLLMKCNDEYCILRKNTPCVIVGRNQNTLADINPDYLQRNHIPVNRLYVILMEINDEYIRKGVAKNKVSIV